MRIIIFLYGDRVNILLVADVSIADVIGGAERVLYEQSTFLARRGHVVHILTRQQGRHESEHGIYNGTHEWRYPINQKHQLLFFVSILRNAGQLFESLHSKNRYQCLNFHQPLSAYSVCKSPAVKGIKKIYTCHSLSFEEFISRNPKPAGLIETVVYMLHVFLRKQIERTVLKASDSIVALSQYTKEKLQSTYEIDAGRITVIPGGVDLERFYPVEDKKGIRQNLGIPENRIVLLTVRNLVRRMGLENLILAMERIRRTSAEIFLVIGGEGPLRKPLSEMAEKLDLDHHIRFTGFIPENQLPDFYRMADIFVLPTKELEGFGLVTLESMASGVPVLGTPIGGTREILSRFDPNLLFEDMTSSAMADQIEKTCRLIRDYPEKWKETCLRARKFVEANYRWDQNIQMLETVMAS